MGKRKRSDRHDSDSVEKLLKKVKKLVKKRRRISSSSSESEPASPPLHSPPHDLTSDLEPQDEIITAEVPLEGEGTADENPDELDPDVLQLLGSDPTLNKSFGDNLHKDLATRWKHILINGLTKEDKVNLQNQYLPAENCIYMKAPMLNPELKSALSDANIKKDSYSEQKQNQMASCISAIGKALNIALSQTENIPQEVIKTLSDAGRLICDTHYRESLSRRFTIINAISKQKREIIKNTKIDDYLFGSNLSDYLKSTKAITMSASELRFTANSGKFNQQRNQPSTSTYRQTGALNARGAPRAPAAEQRAYPNQTRRQPPPPPRDHRRAQTASRLTCTGGQLLSTTPLIITSQGGASPPCGSHPDGREIIRQSLLRRGIPSASLDIMMASFPTNTLNQYNTSLKSWWLYCSSKGFDYCDANISQLIEFLTHKFNSGASYTTLNSYRSALSILLGQEVTCNDTVKRFFKGIYRIKLPAPKYHTTWNPNLVLNYLTNYFPNDLITLKELSLKSVTLLALASAQRMQTLSLIKIKNITIDSEKILIKIEDLIKTSRPGAYQPLIILPYIKENPKVCPALTLKYYIDKTASIRNQEDSLFISYQKPHKKVGSQTLSHWVKQILQNSGIDITLYGAHSTRHASTSAAHRAGVNLEAIRKAAGWTESSHVFQKYYNKNLCTSNETEFISALFR